MNHHSNPDFTRPLDSRNEFSFKQNENNPQEDSKWSPSKPPLGEEFKSMMVGSDNLREPLLVDFNTSSDDLPRFIRDKVKKTLTSSKQLKYDNDYIIEPTELTQISQTTHTFRSLLKP